MANAPIPADHDVVDQRSPAAEALALATRRRSHALAAFGAGVSPLPSADFVTGRCQLTAGLAFMYCVRVSKDIACTRCIGAAQQNLLQDRDNAEAVVKHSGSFATMSPSRSRFFPPLRSASDLTAGPHRLAFFWPLVGTTAPGIKKPRVLRPGLVISLPLPPVTVGRFDQSGATTSLAARCGRWDTYASNKNN